MPSESPYAMPMSDDVWDFMQFLAREHEKDAEWCIYPEAFDYRPLVWLGLVEQDSEMRVRLTRFGWLMLADGLERC